MSELDQNPAWIQIGSWQVSSELFPDLVFTEECNCSCPWGIARTIDQAEELSAWKNALAETMRHPLFRETLFSPLTNDLCSGTIIISFDRKDG